MVRATLWKRLELGNVNLQRQRCASYRLGTIPAVAYICNALLLLAHLETALVYPRRPQLIVLRPRHETFTNPLIHHKYHLCRDLRT